MDQCGGNPSGGEWLRNLASVMDSIPLCSEDILNTDQRPKMEVYGGYVYIVLKMLYGNHSNRSIEVEQVSLILGSNFVISFQEGIEGDVFNPVRERIRSGKGLIRKMGPDYLAYSLIDTIVDNYFLILEKLGERIELLEEELVARPTTTTLQEIQKIKYRDDFCKESGLAFERGHQGSRKERIAAD